MSISSSLNAGVMGLAVNATRLATISDNIANSATNGYKRSDVDFSSMVLRQQENAYSAGGVRVTTFKDVEEQGGLISTGNATDISVSGRGLIPVTTVDGVYGVNNTQPLLLTTTGSFSADENGFLRTQSGLFLQGWAADANGDIPSLSRDNSSGLEPVNVSVNQFTASPTSTITLGVNLPADSTQAGASGDTFTLPTEYFDNLGRSQNLQLTFTPTVPATGASNQWNVSIIDEAGDPLTPVASFDLTFSDTPTNGGKIATVTTGAGATYDAATGNIALTTASGPLEITVGTVGGNTGLTQLSSGFSPYNVTKDGAPIGDLVNVEIDGQGYLEAVYDTGFRRTLYQIPVGDVPNMNGLTPEDNQAFSVSQASGDIYFWDAGSGPVGATIGYALIESTTDVASELTDLIQTQRAYSTNAKIIQTVDEMLQETTNIKR